MFALNTLAPINLTRAALPAMLARRCGRIVLVSSMAGRIPAPGQAIYSACKAGVNGYFSTLLTEIHDRCAIREHHVSCGTRARVCWSAWSFRNFADLTIAQFGKLGGSGAVVQGLQPTTAWHSFQ